MPLTPNCTFNKFDIEHILSTHPFDGVIVSEHIPHAVSLHVLLHPSPLIMLWSSHSSPCHGSTMPSPHDGKHPEMPLALVVHDNPAAHVLLVPRYEHVFALHLPVYVVNTERLAQTGAGVVVQSPFTRHATQ